MITYFNRIFITLLLAVSANYFQHILKCEESALQLGTRLADSFNSPFNGENWEKRLYQNYITENLGFAPFMSKGLRNSDGLTTSGQIAKDLQSKGGWTDHEIDDSPYRSLNHKWVYMVGDSTTRQIWASYAAPFQGNSFERNAKEWSRHYVSIINCKSTFLSPETKIRYHNEVQQTRSSHTTCQRWCIPRRGMERCVRCQ